MHEKNQSKHTDLTCLPNIGKEMKKQLNEVGINTPDDLITTGSREAWLMIRAIDESACYNRLCGLEGAIQGIRWHHLDDDVKKELKEFFDDNR